MCRREDVSAISEEICRQSAQEERMLRDLDRFYSFQSQFGAWFLLSRQGGLLSVHRGEHHEIVGATLAFINPLAIYHAPRLRERHPVMVNP
jgi:hypothetical protein